MYPVWSKCACVNTHQSKDRGLLGQSVAQLRKRNCFKPWNRPQSTRSRLPSASTRYLEPVTVPAAPRNVSLGIGGVF